METAERRTRPAGRFALLDHVEVSMQVLDHDTPGVGERRDEIRSAPRLHFVRGHLVRRGGGIHWRIAHMRGSASGRPVLSRTVSLKFAAPRDVNRPLSEGASGGVFPEP